MADGRTSPAPAPAAARAAQINAAVQLENLAAQLSADGSTEGLSARSARPALAIGAGLRADAAAVGLPAPQTDGEPDFAGRIVRGLSAMVSQRGGVMTMRLRPPELGSLRVQMSIIQGAVSAQFTATTEHAQMLLERNLAVLQGALQSNGLTVEKLGVHLASAESSSTTRQEADSQSQQHQQQESSEHDAAGRESRGRHDGERPALRRSVAAPADFAASLGETGGADTPFTEPTSLGAE
jgi:flagellar hook-length control protein FliK